MQTPPFQFYSAKVADEIAPKAEISLSDKCVEKLKELLSEPKSRFLRIAVEGGGCSGFQYKFNLDDKMMEDDRIFEREGAKVVVDETSLEFIKGAVIDYYEELIKSSFRVISNSEAEQGCSCGASFAVK